MKKIEDYLHLYLGCECLWEIEHEMTAEGGTEILDGHLVETAKAGLRKVKPILRPLSDMTEEEAQYFAWMCMNKPTTDNLYAISQDEIQIEPVPNDNGMQLDNDILLYIDVSCRCWEGGICFNEDGSIYVTDHDGKQEPALHDMAGKIRWLLSKGFDLFNLIPEGLAITPTS